MKTKVTLAVGAFACLAANSFAQLAIDGSLNTKYGSAISVQTIGTSFGDSSLGQQFFANGSELDNAYAKVIGGNLYIFLGGNLESNFNKFELFIDSKAGGQNRLLSNNPGVSFGGLLRMSDDGSGNGLTFDSGVEPDYWISFTGGDVGGGVYGAFVDGAELLTAGGGVGEFLGGVSDFSTGQLSGGNNIFGVSASINNSNIAGVDGSSGGASSGAGVATGLEFCIPLSAIGATSGNIKIVAFVNGGGHDFISNQFLAPLPGGSNHAGEPRAVNLATVADDQYFSVPVPGSFAPSSVTLVQGTPFGGNLASLATSDDDKYFILNDESDVNAEVQFFYSVGNPTAQCLNFVVETSSDRSDQTMFIDLKAGPSFVNVGSTTTTLTDSVRDVVINTNASQYIGVGGTVNARLRFIPFADLEAADGWSQRIDLARVEIVQ